MPRPTHASKSSTSQAPSTTLTLAELLSDLTTLRLCDPAAAMALVSARPSNSPRAQELKGEQETDPDLRRAKELVEFYYKVKVRQQEGELGKALDEARALVRRAVE
jgi:hypothetical protein